MYKHDKSIGFTLIELLIVIIIIAILAVIGLPQFLNAQDRAKQGQTASNMRTAATAITLYNTENGQYPGGSSVAPTSISTIADDLVPAYLPGLNHEDAWGFDIQYSTNGAITATDANDNVIGGPFSFVLRSPGKGGVFEGLDYVVGNTATFSDDIVIINGFFVRSPVGTQTQAPIAD